MNRSTKKEKSFCHPKQEKRKTEKEESRSVCYKREGKRESRRTERSQ